MPKARIPAFARKNGTPILNGSGANGAMYRRTQDDDRLRPRPPNHFADYATLLSPERWRELVSESRAAAAKGFLSALIDNKASYVSASHWRPRFTGTDADYGARATAALESALKIADIRGFRFTWSGDWGLSTRNFADAGAFFVLLTSWPGTNQPALQFIEAHRIGQREKGPRPVGATEALTTIVSDDGTEKTIRGAYAGLTIDNGIITTEAGTEVAFRVLGATSEQDIDVSARDMMMVGAPKSYSECRPAPDIAPSLLDFMAVDLAQTCALDQQIADARLTMIEKNTEGQPTPAQRALRGNSGSTANGTANEVSERAGVRFIKSGNELEGFSTSRPSDQAAAFDKRVKQVGSAAFNWPAAMLDPADLRGAATRAFQDQVNTAIADDFYATAPCAARCVKYFIAKLTQNGELEKHEEWMEWGIAPPPWLEVDRASARIDLEEVAAGRVPMSTLHQRDGKTTAEVYRARAHDRLLAEAIAKETGVDVSIIQGDNGMTAARVGQQPNQETTIPEGGGGSSSKTP